MNICSFLEIQGNWETSAIRFNVERFESLLNLWKLLLTWGLRLATRGLNWSAESIVLITPATSAMTHFMQPWAYRIMRDFCCLLCAISGNSPWLLLTKGVCGAGRLTAGCHVAACSAGAREPDKSTPWPWLWAPTLPASLHDCATMNSKRQICFLPLCHSSFSFILSWWVSHGPPCH